MNTRRGNLYLFNGINIAMLTAIKSLTVVICLKISTFAVA